MKRERVDGSGRFGRVSEPAGAEGQERGAEAAKPQGRPPRPAYCRVYARRRLAEAMPSLVAKLLEEAGNGSLAHLKVLVQLSGLDTGEVVPPKKRRSRSLEAVLLERWEQDKAELEADRARDRQQEQERAAECARQQGEAAEGRRMDEGF